MDYPPLNVLSDLFGWIYLLSWSASFYPQVIMNYELKSVEGFHLDYPFLNISGYIFLSFSYSVGYFLKESNPYENYGLGTIRVQDLLFAYHALILAIITWIQCLIYERGANKVSTWSIIFTIFAYGTSAILYVATDVKNWMPTSQDFNVVLYMGYLKLAVTMFKYIPLVIWNYQRKATSGFSVGFTLFDLVGGFLSIAQNFIDLADGTTEVLNPIKLGLGVVTIFYDLILMFQHYFLYGETNSKKTSVRRLGQDGKRRKRYTRVDRGENNEENP